MPPSPQLLLILHDHIYTTLIDTGSDVSFIDISVVQFFSLSTRPSDLLINLASHSISQPSLGRTSPLTVTPVIVLDSIQQAPTVPPHIFEILDLDVELYQFIIGKDLMPTLFPKGIPIELVCSNPDSSTTTSSAVNTIPTSPIEVTPPVSPNHIASTQLPSWPFDGEGHIPQSEQPTRVATSTPMELEQEYRRQRDRIMNLPSIIAVCKHNESITGFCNIPEAVLKLKLDPERGSPTALYARQYPLSQRCIEAATPVIERWLSTGRIAPAPAGCPYNNPLTVAPKKDDQGQLTGFRVCLDVRRLNLAIIEPDQFQIPIIRVRFLSSVKC